MGAVWFWCDMLAKHFVNIFLLAYFCSVVCGATSTYYVATYGTTNNYCSEALPCRSLREAFLVVSSSYNDIIIYVGGGSYEGTSNIATTFPYYADSVTIIEWVNSTNTESPVFNGNGAQTCFTSRQTLTMTNITISDCQTAIYTGTEDLTLNNVIITNPSGYARTGISSTGQSFLGLYSCSLTGSHISTTVDTLIITDTSVESSSSASTFTSNSFDRTWQISSSKFYSPVTIFADDDYVSIDGSYFTYLNIDAYSNSSPIRSLVITNTIFDCVNSYSTGILVDGCDIFVVDNSTFTNACNEGISGSATNFTISNSNCSAINSGVQIESSVSVVVNNTLFDSTGANYYSMRVDVDNYNLPIIVNNSTFNRDDLSSYAAIYIYSSYYSSNTTISNSLFNNTLALDFASQGSVSCSNVTVHTDTQQESSYYAFTFNNYNTANEVSFAKCNFYGEIGAIYSYDVSSLNISESTFVKCKTSSQGGALMIQSNAHINLCNFTKCYANTGGAIYASLTDYSYSYVTILNSTFDSNEAETQGGAIYISNSYCTDYGLNLNNVTFTNNLAEYGSAMYCYDDDEDCGDITIDNMVTSSNYNSYGGDDVACKYNISTAVWYLWVILFLGSTCLCCMIFATVFAAKIALKHLNTTSKYEPIPEN